MSRPRVGICAAIEQARWAAWDVEVNLSQRTYSREVAEAGAQPLLLPPTQEMTAAPDEVLDLLDALILAGGSDVDPADLRRRARRADQERPRPSATLFELALARAARSSASCRCSGSAGGCRCSTSPAAATIDQHLETASTHLHTPGEFSDHEVALEPGSLAARAVGAERVSVHSHHHQGVGRLGEGLVVTGRAARRRGRGDRAARRRLRAGDPLAHRGGARQHA